MSSPEPPDPLPRRFGRYVLFDKIGEGGMARIYLGRTRTDLGGELLMAVKQIIPLLSSSHEFCRSLTDEAKLAAKLSHGNIAQVHDLGRDQGMLYIAMEYVEGFDLRQLLTHCSKNRVGLPIEFSLLIVVEVLRALDYAHRKTDDGGTPLGIVHRDVSPSNVLLSFDGEVKLCDFGIARAIGVGEDLSLEAIQGKAGYMSPEAARGDSLDARTDLYSAGIILWELISGRRLHKGKPTLEQAIRLEVPRLPERGYPDEARLHGIVMRALHKDRNLRFESARDMLGELEDYVADAAMYASPLRFGSWLMENFGSEIVLLRRMRERAAKALESGPLVSIEALRSGEPEMEPAIESRPGNRIPLAPAPQPAPASEPAFARTEHADAYLPPPPESSERPASVRLPRLEPPPKIETRRGKEPVAPQRRAIEIAAILVLVLVLVAALALLSR